MSAGLLSVLMAVMGVSFANDAGTSTLSVGGGGDSGVAVHPVPDSGGVGALANAYGADVDLVLEHGTTKEAPKQPSWEVAAGSAGSADPGDLAYIDATAATSTKMMVSVFVTNMAALSANYTSWLFGLQLYEWNGSSPLSGGAWAPVEIDSAPAPPLVITSDSGTVNWVVDVETAANKRHFSLALEDGSFYAADADPGSLSPSFFIRATQL